MDYNFFFSYWDWIPVEIQEIILNIAKALVELDRLRMQKISIFLPELKQIHELNEKWNKHRKYGLVTFKISQCSEYYCDSYVPYKYYKKCNQVHSIIIGYNIDEENKKRKNFLGYNYSNAKQRMNHVQSFL